MQHLDAELSTLKKQLLVMGSHAEAAMNRAVAALTQRDDRLAEQVKQDDSILDRFEIEIDEMAIAILAQAPLASDLRLVTVAMKVSTNLERVGDEASKIAKRAHELNQDAPLKAGAELPQLARHAREMLQAALDAFVHGDSTTARALIARDKEIDALNRRIHAELEQLMMADPSTIKRCLHLMVVSKSLERIADHAKNVAEEVVYLREALDIRHAQQRTPPAPSSGGSPAR